MGMRMKDDEVLEVLEDCRAILRGHFLLASGMHSDTYFQCARLFERPAAAKPVLEELAERTRALRPAVVAAPAIGGILPAYELARGLGARAVYLEKVDGAFLLRRGFEVAPGERVLVAEDVITTGESARAVAERLRGSGAEIVGFASVVYRGGGSSFEGLTTLVQVSPAAWGPGHCPLCREGRPLETPGGVRS